MAGEAMHCSYCCEPLPDDSVAVENLPMESKDNTSCLHVDDLRGRPFLHLHGECVAEVIKGLQFGQRLVMN
jgi:hypothetical protein